MLFLASTATVKIERKLGKADGSPTNARFNLKPQDAEYPFKNFKVEKGNSSPKKTTSPSKKRQVETTRSKIDYDLQFGETANEGVENATSPAKKLKAFKANSCMEECKSSLKTKSTFTKHAEAPISSTNHVGADDNYTSSAKKNRRAKKNHRAKTTSCKMEDAVNGSSVGDSMPVKTNEAINVAPRLTRSIKADTASNQVKEMKIKVKVDKESDDDLAGKPQANVFPLAKKIPVGQKSHSVQIEAGCQLRSSVKVVIEKLTSAQKNKFSKDRHLESNPDIQAADNSESKPDTQAVEEDESMDTLTTFTKIPLKTYSPSKRRETVQTQGKSQSKDLNSTVATKPSVLKKGGKGKVQSTAQKILALWTEPALIYSPPGKAGRMLNSKRGQIKNDADQDHQMQESPEVKGILKISLGSGGRQKKNVRFSDLWGGPTIEVQSHRIIGLGAAV